MLFLISVSLVVIGVKLPQFQILSQLTEEERE